MPCFVFYLCVPPILGGNCLPPPPQMATLNIWSTADEKRKKSLFETLFLDLGVTYALHLWLVGKPVVDFILVVIELFSLSPTVETLWAEIGRVRRFSRADFRGKGHRPPTIVGIRKLECRFMWYQNIRSASFSFVTIHASDGQTDGRTKFRQQYRALHYMQSHSKMERLGVTQGHWN